MTTEEPGKTKNMLLRLDPELAEQLQAVAQVEGRSISDVAREAIAALVEQRRHDQRFLKLLDDNLARHQRLLRLLRDGPPCSRSSWPTWSSSPAGCSRWTPPPRSTCSTCRPPEPRWPPPHPSTPETTPPARPPPCG